MLFQSDRLRLESVDRIATLGIGSPVASNGLLRDLGRALDVVRRSPFLDVLVIRGNGPGHFLSGPDLVEIDALTDGESARGFAAAGQAVLERLEALSETTLTVAYIDGRCDGAGLELALACDYRLAVAKPETLIGCNSLERGLFPCWGLTRRLPRLIGVGPALNLMLNERPIPARAARAFGLVDHAFGPRPAKTELWAFVADLQDRPRVPNRVNGRRGFWSRLRDSRPLVRRTALRNYLRAFPRADQQALIRAVERGWFAGPAEGAASERAAFLAFRNDPDSRERREAARRFEQCAAESHSAARPARWGIIGMGLEAVELALLLLRAGHAVSFAEPNARTRTIGTRQFEAGLERCVNDGWLNVVEAGQKRAAVAVTDDERRLPCADVYAFTRDPRAVRCRPGAEWASPDQCVTLRFDGPPLSARTVTVSTEAESAEFSAGLVNGLTRWGLLVNRQVETAPARALEFAA